MNTTTLGTAAGSGGAAYAIVTLISWALSYAHVAVPDNVSNAMLVLVTIGIHYIVADKKSAVVADAPTDGVVVSAKPAAVPYSPLAGVSALAQPAQIG